MKPLPIVLAVFALGTLAAMALLLYEPVDPADADALNATPIAAPGEDSGKRMGLTGELTNAPRVNLDAAVSALAEAPAPVTDAVPASYRAALGAVTGRVIEQDGTPVARLNLELLGGGLADILSPMDVLARGGSAELDLELGSTATDDQGHFRFEGLEPRLLGLLVIDPAGPRAHLHILEETPVSGSERNLGDIVLPGSVTLRGRVVNERNEAVAGLRVRSTDLPPMVLATGVADWRFGGAVLVDVEEDGEQVRMVIDPPMSLQRAERLLPLPTTETESDGAFVLVGVRPGLASLILDGFQYLTSVEGPFPTGAAGGERDLGTLVIRDGLPVRGRVVTENDKPVPGAQVRVGSTLPMAPVTLLRPIITADENGRFELKGLREGPVRAAARLSAHHDWSLDLGGSQAGGEVKVVLAARRTLTLKLVDPEGQPVEQARFFGRPLPMEQASEMPDFLMPPKSRGDEQGVTRDEAGRWVIADMDPALWDLLIVAEGHASVRGQHDLRNGDLTTEIGLQLSSGMPLRVLTGADRLPVEWAQISARRTDQGDRGMPRPVTAARTDKDGAAVLEDLAEGSYLLEVSHPKYAVLQHNVELPLPEDEPVLELMLSLGGVIRGVVLENGAAPDPAVMVTLSRADDNQSAGGLPRLTLTNTEGAFSFHDVDPGEVKLEARERVSLASLTSWWEPFAMTPLSEQELFVEAEQEVEAVLIVGSSWADIPTGFVEGRVLVNGQPGAGWKVRTWGKIRRSVTAGGDGRFTLGQIASGAEAVVLMVSAPNQGMMEGTVDTHSFVLLEGERRYEEISISTGAVSGRVTSSIDGRPLPGAEVRLQTHDGDKERWFGRRGGSSITDSDGAFQFATVAAGQYTVQAEAQGLAGSRSAVFDVTSGSTRRGVEIRLSRSVTVRGRVLFDGLEETPTWAYLSATTETGERSGTRVDLETGTFVFDDLAPERNWSVGCYLNTDEELNRVELFVRSDRSDVELVFRPLPPPEPEQLDETQLKQLEALGYTDGDGD